MTTVREALNALLLYDDDYAESLNDVGFNRTDTGFAHSVAAQDQWTEKQQSAIYRMLRKYRGQLSNLGINYTELVFEETREVQFEREKREREERLRLERERGNVLDYVDGKFRWKTLYEFLDVVKSISDYDHRHWDAENKEWVFDADYDKVVLDIDAAVKEYNNQFKIIVTERAESYLKKRLEEIEREKNGKEVVQFLKKNELPDVPVPLNAELFEHQKRGFMISSVIDASALLMEQGTGKTLTAIATVGKWFLDDNVDKMLVICPLSVVEVWYNEFKKFAAFPYDVQIAIGTKSKKESVFDPETLKEGVLNVRVISYDSISSRRRKKKDDDGNPVMDAYGKPMYEESGGLVGSINRWIESCVGESELTISEQKDMARNRCVVLLDESQRIKNRESNRAKAIHEIGDRVRKKLILTGTPVTQNPLDIWSQYRFLNRNVFSDNFYRFRGKYAIMGGWEGKEVIGYRNLDDMTEKAHSVAFRVTKEEALDLPEFTDQTLFVHLEESKQYYKDMSEKAKAVIDGEKKRIRDLREKFEEEHGGEIRDFRVDATVVLSQLLRLSQITGGHITRVNEEGKKEYIKIGEEKLRALGEFIEDFPRDKKIVIACRFIPEISMICEQMRKLGRTCDVIHGGTKNRGEVIRRFQDEDDPNILVIQIQTAGLGITLTRADTMIFYSYDFSFANYEQARARVHRIGQRNFVTYINMVMKDTVDEMIMDALHRKKHIADIVVDLVYGDKLDSSPLDRYGEFVYSESDLTY